MHTQISCIGNVHQWPHFHLQVSNRQQAMDNRQCRPWGFVVKQHVWQTLVVVEVRACTATTMHDSSHFQSFLQIYRVISRYAYLYIYINVYIYIYRERERDRERYIDIYTQVHHWRERRSFLRQLNIQSNNQLRLASITDYYLT